MRKAILYGLFFNFSFSVFFLGNTDSSRAQVISDTSLPFDSVVEDNQGRITINGGTIAGNNLFHSFSDFSVSNNKSVLFDNPLKVTNIFSRITGNKISRIDSLIATKGDTNFFLINPNGIIFGPNSQLNIGGSFLATTAHKLQFADGSAFDAVGALHSPVLTMSVPIGLQIGSKSKNIINYSRFQNASNGIVGLKVETGKSIALVGNGLSFKGGYLTAPQGNIGLGSFNSGSRVNISLDPDFRISHEGSSLTNIHFSKRALATVSGEGAGRIHLLGNNIVLTDTSKILADTLGRRNGQGIFIEGGALKIDKGSFISSIAFGHGIGGDISINVSRSIKVNGDGFERFQKVFVEDSISGNLDARDRENGIFGGSSGSGSAGDISIFANRLSLLNGGVISAFVFGDGSGQNLSINTLDSTIVDSSGIIASVSRTGTKSSGNIDLNTRDLSIRGGGFIANGTLGSGDSGEINIDASRKIEVQGFPENAFLSSSIASVSFAGATGKGGDINIFAEELSVLDGAGIGSSSGVFSARVDIPSLLLGGPAGDLSIHASKLIKVVGTSPDGIFRSRINNETFNSSAAGEISIHTRRLRASGGGQISTATLKDGRGGSLKIDASEFIQLSGVSDDSIFQSGLLASSGNSNFLDAEGTGGNISVSTPNLNVDNRAVIAVNSFGEGRAGNIKIDTNFLHLNEVGSITATTTAGNSGNIDIEAHHLLLRRNSLISTEADGPGNGGNINIDAGIVLAVPSENSDIFASANEGDGGRIRINTQGLFGFQRGKISTSLSDIVASSQSGMDGTVDIQILDSDPNQGLQESIDPRFDDSSLIARNCSSIDSTVNQLGEFIITGRGGLPAHPNDILGSSALLTNWVNVAPFTAIVPKYSSESQLNAIGSPIESQSQLVEAQGWKTNTDGKLMLIAESQTLVTEIATSPTPCQRS